ncbi:DNA-processing protein DprA [Staphylococcus simulans]|uniref:DNA-processing protein DprA n=1 Tax=Staphylococcus simulans TaxID=1286 RepID=UPI000D1F70B2|nr:DNA-processing protein DprA [Staphylococcus simulans]MDY5059395.1 DNA-processing protein DprA [Staphylococcus simulans]PTJ14870.1 DNA-protecting protein DprA [Staphylococcus simulans]
MNLKELDLELLRLRYASYSTKQIYALLIRYPDYFDLNLPERMTKLRQFSQNSTSKHSILHYQTYCEIDPFEIYQVLIAQDIQLLSIFHPDYPHLLKHIYAPPLLLFCKGNITCLKAKHHLSIVGSREATCYTQNALAHLLKGEALHDLVIVSGLAKGGDAFAHEAALHYNMATIGVLAFGHYHHYPKETRVLRNNIEQTGLTISEYTPAERPARYKFPERNRIISGLSQGVLITESRERSGAQITIDLALEQNRNVYVLPGSIFQKLTIGNLKRAQEGAKIVLSAQDIIEDYKSLN